MLLVTLEFDWLSERINKELAMPRFYMIVVSHSVAKFFFNLLYLVRYQHEATLPTSHFSRSLCVSAYSRIQSETMFISTAQLPRYPPC